MKCQKIDKRNAITFHWKKRHLTTIYLYKNTAEIPIKNQIKIEQII